MVPKNGTTTTTTNSNSEEQQLDCAITLIIRCIYSREEKTGSITKKLHEGVRLKKKKNVFHEWNLSSFIIQPQSLHNQAKTGLHMLPQTVYQTIYNRENKRQAPLETYRTYHMVTQQGKQTNTATTTSSLFHRAQPLSEVGEGSPPMTNKDTYLPCIMTC